MPLLVLDVIHNGWSPIHQLTSTATPFREVLMLGMTHRNLERDLTPRQLTRGWNSVTL